RLIEALPPGSMLAVRMEEGELVSLLPAGLSLAAVNTPSQCVVAGSTEDIDAFAAALAARGAVHRRLKTSHAFHSSMMDPAVAPPGARGPSIRLQTPRIPFVSSVTGTWIRTAEATDPAYWSAHLREPVRFARAAETLLGDECRALLEVGPGQTLAPNARR